MYRNIWTISLLALATVLMPVVGFAAESGQDHSGMSMDASATTTDAKTQSTDVIDTTSQAAQAVTQDAAQTSAATQAIPDSTASQPVVTPPALKPIVITFSGDLSTVDAKATPNMITVQDRYGVRKEISVPAEAKINQGGMAKTLADLKANDKLTVEYTYDVATGKRTAQSIIIGESSAKPAGA